MRRVIRKRIRRSGSGIELAAGIDAVIAVNAGQDGQEAAVRAHSEIRNEQGGAAGTGTRRGARDTEQRRPDEEAAP